MQRILKNSLLLTVFILNQFLSASAIETNQRVQIINQIGELNGALNLICQSNGSKLHWYKTVNNSEYISITIDDHYSIFNDTENEIYVLTIKSLNKSDEGDGIYKLCEEDEEDNCVNEICSYNIYLYVNESKYNGLFQVYSSQSHNYTFKLNGSEYQEILNIKFEEPTSLDITYLYKLEAYPLKNLIINISNDIQTVDTNCTELDVTNNELNCLKSTGHKLFSQKIIFQLSYNYDHVDIINIKPIVYTFEFNIKHSPKVNINGVVETALQNESIEPKCRVEQSNENDEFIYYWEIEQNIQNKVKNITRRIIKTKNIEDTFKYKIEKDFEEIKITCYVRNGVYDGSYRSIDSDTVKKATSLDAPGKTETLPLWAVLVMWIGPSVLLIVVATIVINVVLRNKNWYYCRKAGSKAYAEQRKQNDYESRIKTSQF